MATSGDSGRDFISSLVIQPDSSMACGADSLNSQRLQSRPLCVDLFCGLGGWAAGFLAEGYDVIGFDIERHDYGTGGYPGQLVLQDVLTLHGSQFREAAVIVASPPCQEYSYMAMPWRRARQIAAEYRSGVRDVKKLTALFDACFRIAKEAGVPLIVENVKGAQPWVGRAKWHYGSFYLWGDVPTLMPTTSTLKLKGGDRNKDRSNGHRWTHSFADQIGFSDATKNGGGSWFNIAHNTDSGVNRNPVHEASRKGTGGSWFTPTEDGRTVKGYWRDGACITRNFSSKSNSRKAASAQIAKIPFPLAHYIARCFKPTRSQEAQCL